MRRTIAELIILSSLSVMAALIGNQVLPTGIPLVGQWDSSGMFPNAGGRCKPDIVQISDDRIADLFLSDRFVFLDARPVEDYMEGHIPGAVSVPVGSFDEVFLDFMDRYPLDTWFVVYCSGIECHDSMLLAEDLKRQGYMNLYVYSEGFQGWKAAGRPIKTGESP